MLVYLKPRLGVGKEAALSCKVRQEDARHIHFSLQTLQCFLSTTE